MKNRLESFVHDHRNGFDTDMPETDPWPSIAVNAPTTAHQPKSVFLSIKLFAAAMLGLFNGKNRAED